MTRKKVKLAFIEDDLRRRTCFRKRKKGLIKKVQELGTLCDIDVCVIICSPYDAEPQVWPETPSKVEELLSRFKQLSEIQQCRKMVDQEGFIKRRIMKVREQAKKISIDNRLKEMKWNLRQILAGKLPLKLGALDLTEIRWSILLSLKEISLRAVDLRQQIPPPPPPVPMPTVETNVENLVEPPAVVAPEIPVNENQNQTAAARNMNGQQPNDVAYFDDFVLDESLLYSILEFPDEAPTLAFL